MGFSSFTCAKTHLPIMASTSWGTDYSSVVMLSKDGSIVRGIYDGYGRLETELGEIAVYDKMGDGGKDDAKMVHSRFYKGEKFADLGPSHHEPGQGHFHVAARLKEWFAKGGFPSYKDYCRAFEAAMDGASDDPVVSPAKAVRAA